MFGQVNEFSLGANVSSKVLIFYTKGHVKATDLWYEHAIQKMTHHGLEGAAIRLEEGRTSSLLLEEWAAGGDSLGLHGAAAPLLEVRAGRALGQDGAPGQLHNTKISRISLVPARRGRVTRLGQFMHFGVIFTSGLLEVAKIYGLCTFVHIHKRYIVY